MNASGASTSQQQKTKASQTAAELFAEFVTHYDEADELCKQVQLFRKAAGIPAINEMRYAGYHLRLAFDANGKLADLDQLRKARGHAQRATYEAAEAGLLLALGEISLFKEDYRKVIVTTDVKDYLDILSRCEEAKKRLGVKREIGDDQKLDHAKHRELFQTLSRAADMLHAARPEINKRMSENRTGKVRWIVTSIIAVIAILLAFFRDKIFSIF